MVTIVQKGDEVLRKQAQPVDPKDIATEHIQSVITDMKEALAGEEDGVAIAAPQIGESLRIFVVSHKVFENRGEDVGNDMVFINPRIINQSKAREWMEEGCLSVRWWYGEVQRHKQVTVQAYNEKGDEIQMGASGLLAQIFQHEIDHLDGTLFVDKAENLKEIDPSNNEEA